MVFVGPDLPEPMEFLDLEHGNTVQLTITKYELGTTTIHPTKITPRHIRIHMDQNSLTEAPVAGTPITVRIPVLRIWGTAGAGFGPSGYLDISAKTLIANLQPRLYANGGQPLTVQITANGYKPTKRYSVETG